MNLLLLFLGLASTCDTIKYDSLNLISTRSKLVKKDKNFCYFDIFVTNHFQTKVLGINFPEKFFDSNVSYSTFPIEYWIVKRTNSILKILKRITSKPLKPSSCRSASIDLVYVKTVRDKVYFYEYNFKYMILDFGHNGNYTIFYDSMGLNNASLDAYKSYNENLTAIIYPILPSNTFYFGIKINKKFYRKAKVIEFEVPVYYWTDCKIKYLKKETCIGITTSTSIYEYDANLYTRIFEKVENRAPIRTYLKGNAKLNDRELVIISW